jgi:hypothetical protein
MRACLRILVKRGLRADPSVAGARRRLARIINTCGLDLRQGLITFVD